LVLGDIRTAANTLRPIYEQTQGRDGYVSIEVAPDLAYDTRRTIAEARRLFSSLGLPNIMIKIPGTPEGIPAFQQAITESINVNVTLVFSLDNYRRVAEAYIAGLEARYAEELIGPDTVDTMPLATITAFLDHAHVARTIDRDVETWRTHFDTIERAGISMAEVTWQLQQEGVQKFADSFNELMTTIRARRDQMLTHAS